MKVFLILGNMYKIQDTYMNTFFQLCIGITGLKLFREKLSQIEQRPGVPVREAEYLHFQINSRSVFQQHTDIIVVSDRLRAGGTP